MTVDKLTVEVVKSTLIYISEEMGVALKKSAYSPNIRERADHTCAILDQRGRTIGQAEQIPVHIGSLPMGLKNTLRYLENEGVEPKAGDMFVVNDPYIAGTHLNDVTVIRPVFMRERLVGYTANKAHQVDVGGMSPASITVSAVELLQEGIVLPPVKLMEQDKLRAEVLQVLASNTRMPDVTLGDLRAQVAANLLGERRLLELLSRIDLNDFWDGCDMILEHTNTLVRDEYSNMPKGSWEAEDYLELGETLVTIKAKASLTGESVGVDFEGTDLQVEAPLNAVLGVTTAAVSFAVRSLLSSDIPMNDGFNRTVEIKAPEGTLVNPRKPAPVAAGNLETSQRIVDVVYKALAQAMPERIPAAPYGSMNNLMMGGVTPFTEKTWAFYETIGGGYGARPTADGVDGVHANMTNTLNTPIEVMEHYYPIKFVTYKLRDASGGLGHWRGGMGIERSFTAKATIRVTLMGERSKVRPWGLRGGLPGEPSEYTVRRRSGQVARLNSKDMIILEPGDTLVIRTAGGGGYGEPSKRSPELVKQDLENQCITEEQVQIFHSKLLPKRRDDAE